MLTQAQAPSAGSRCTALPPSSSSSSSSSRSLTFFFLHDSGTGAISWFPVHCTSINNTNDLISGDNKGVASQFLEKWAAKQTPTGSSHIKGPSATGSSQNKGPSATGSSQNEGPTGNGQAEVQLAEGFVAAFGQANVGDTSPNIQGAFCQDTGQHHPCPLVYLCSCQNTGQHHACLLVYLPRHRSASRLSACVLSLHRSAPHLSTCVLVRMQISTTLVWWHVCQNTG